MVACVEHLVLGDTGALQQLGQPLRLLDRHGSNEDRPALAVQRLDLLDDRGELLALRLVHDVRVVRPDERAVGRDDHDVQLVDLGELRGLGVGRAGHARQLLVHPEVVLEGDRGERLVLALDPNPLLGLDRLVEAVRPPSARHQPAGELVDDDHLPVLQHVVHVALEERVGPESLLDVVEGVDVDGVVQVLDGEELLAAGDPGLRERHGLRLLVDDIVAGLKLLDLVELPLGDGGRPRQLRDDPVDLVVEIRRLLGRARDDEGGAGFVDQDGVDLVDDGVVERALHQLLQGEAHVVPEVVEPELVVRPVRDVGPVRFLAAARPEMEVTRVAYPPGIVEKRGLVLDDGHRQPEEIVEGPHPHGVAPGQVVVDGDDVDALPGEPVEHGGQRRDQRLPLAGGHLGNLSGVEHQAAHELDVEVTHPEPAAPRLAHVREGLGEGGVEIAAVLDGGSEGGGPPPEVGVRQRFELCGQRADRLDPRAHSLDIPLVLRPEDLPEDEVDHRGSIVPRGGERRRGLAAARRVDQLPSVLEARVGHQLAPEHPRHLPHPVRFGERAHLGGHATPFLALLDPEMVIGIGCDLRQVGDAQDLSRARDLTELPPHGVGGLASDPHVHLVEYQNRDCVGRRQHHLQGQHRA